MTSLPDAVHVGFSKCASTFLQAFFAGHPDIFLVNQSHFFAPFAYSNFETGEPEYRRLYDKAAAGQVKLESDEHIILPLFHPVLAAAATTMESVVEVTSRIRSVQPEARIIIVIRNQVDLIVSRYSEYILGGGKCDFDLFVNEFLRCSEDGVNYYQNYYAQIVGLLRDAFGKENVLVLLQEELSRNEDETIERLCEFLKVALRRPERRDIAARRAGLSDLGIKIVRGMNRRIVTRQEMSFRKARVRVPYILYKIVQRAVRTGDYFLPVWIKGDKKAILAPALEARIRAEFREDNARLGQILGKDVASLGYG